MNELNFYRLLHSVLAVARVAAECRQAVNLLARATNANDGVPYTVDELDSAAVDCLAALAEALRAMEHSSVPVQRAVKRNKLGPAVSRETRDTDRVVDPLDNRDPEGYPF